MKAAKLSSAGKTNVLKVWVGQVEWTQFLPVIVLDCVCVCVSAGTLIELAQSQHIVNLGLDPQLDLGAG